MSTRKPRHQPGDFIPLHWEDFAESLYIHGHVTADEFASTCAAENPGPGVVPIPGEPLHQWGAWRFNGQDDYGNPCRTLRTYPVRGRCMFPVTVADVIRWDVSIDTRNPSVWDAEALAEFARKDAMVAAMRNRWVQGSPLAEPAADIGAGGGEG